MAIRCSELSIPAVIGCGEQIYLNLTNTYNKQIFIDCSILINLFNQLMKKIGITQRLGVSKHGELRAQIDINLYKFISKCGYHPVTVPYFEEKLN